MALLHRPFLRAFICLFSGLLFGGGVTFCGDSLTVAREFNLMTSKNASGYFKPLFTSIGESFNSNSYTTALFPKQWKIGLDLSVCGMAIPSSQLTFDAELPESYGNRSITETGELRDGNVVRNQSGTVSQPTIYGGTASPVFSAPQTSVIPSSAPKQPNTATFLEGNDIGFMSGLPALQLAVGLPTQTQLRFRFLPISIQDQSTTYFGLMLSQQFNHWLNLFTEDSLIGLAFNGGFHSVSRSDGIDVQSYAFGLHASKGWKSGLAIYGGLQYEDMTGTIKFYRETDPGVPISKSPYEEIRTEQPMNVAVETFTNFRIAAGASYKTGIVELHADAAYASQPVFSIGMALWFVAIDPNKTKPMDDQTKEGSKP